MEDWPKNTMNTFVSNVRLRPSLIFQFTPLLISQISGPEPQDSHVIDLPGASFLYCIAGILIPKGSPKNPLAKRSRVSTLLSWLAFGVYADRVDLIQHYFQKKNILVHCMGQ